MVDRVDGQTPKGEADRNNKEASTRSSADAYGAWDGRLDSGLDASDGTSLIAARVKSNADTIPTKLPADGAKPEPDAGVKATDPAVVKPEVTGAKTNDLSTCAIEIAGYDTKCGASTAGRRTTAIYSFAFGRFEQALQDMNKVVSL